MGSKSLCRSCSLLYFYPANVLKVASRRATQNGSHFFLLSLPPFQQEGGACVGRYEFDLTWAVAKDHIQDPKACFATRR